MNTGIYKVLNRIVYFDRLLLRRVQLHRDVIRINNGFEHKTATVAISTNLDAMLAKANVDPRIAMNHYNFSR